MKQLFSSLKYRGFIPVIASMFLTSALPVLSPAQVACRSVHTGLVASSAKINFAALLSKDFNRESAKTIMTALEEVQNLSDFKSLLSRMNEGSNFMKDREWGTFFHRISLIPTLEKTLTTASPSEKEQFIHFLNRLLESKSSYEKQGFGRGFGHWTYPLLISLEPARAITFAQNIKSFHDARQSLDRLYTGLDGLSGVNYGLVQALSQLPPQVRAEVLKSLNQQLHEINLESEVLKMNNGLVVNSVIRRHRRNIEMLTHMVLYREVLLLKKNLAAAANSKEITEAIDSYYSSLGEVVSPVRGGYSFEKVAASAKILQQNFRNFLNEKTDYVEIYGSLANGKANFTISDVDMKISESLFKRIMGKTYQQAEGPLFSLYFADTVAKEAGQAPADLLKFWEQYKKAEQDIGTHVFLRPPTRESEMLSTLYPPSPFRDVPTDSRWYNPLTIRVYRDRIEVRVNDLISMQHQSANF